MNIIPSLSWTDYQFEHHQWTKPNFTHTQLTTQLPVTYHNQLKLTRSKHSKCNPIFEKKIIIFNYWKLFEKYIWKIKCWAHPSSNDATHCQPVHLLYFFLEILPEPICKTKSEGMKGGKWLGLTIHSTSPKLYSTKIQIHTLPNTNLVGKQYLAICNAAEPNIELPFRHRRK